MKMRILNGILLLVGTAILVRVLLNPPTFSLMVRDVNNYPVFRREPEYGNWAGQILAVIVATGVACYLTRKRDTGDRPPR
jgi:hypothetical protein